MRRRHIRVFFGLLAISCLCMPECCIAAGDTTQVIIIGTKHDGNRHFDQQYVFNLLEAIRPDIILQEQSKPFRMHSGYRLAYWLGITKSVVESLATRQYKKKYPECDVLSYDTAFARRSYIKEMRRNYTAVHVGLDDAYNRGIMDTADMKAYLDYDHITDFFYQQLFDTTLERLNDPEMVDTVRRINLLDSTVRKVLVEKYISDTALVAWYQNDISFGSQREAYMCKAIRGFVQKAAGKRVVVFSGLNHKPALEECMKTYAPDHRIALLSLAAIGGYVP